MTEAVAAALRQQSEWCAELGSKLYARLCALAGDDVAAGGAVARLVEGWAGEPARAALPLRLLGGAHALVLSGDAPGLARHYPTAGGAPSWPDCGEAFLELVEAQASELRRWLGLNVQTNEPLRSSVLLGGFFTVARESGLPLRLLEIGASAGLNLWFDRYRHDLGVGSWGPPGSPAKLRCEWRGESPAIPDALEVATRAGCDAAPLDAGRAADRLRLRAYVWGDQPHRLARLDAALGAAAGDPPRVEAADAGAWLAAQLAEPVPGAATVVYHSIVWNYLGDQGQRRLEETLTAAADRAGAAAPVYWLRMEPRRGVGTELTLSGWPGGHERKLADCSPHGTWADWAQQP